MSAAPDLVEPSFASYERQARMHSSCEFDDIDPAKDQIRMDEETERLVILVHAMYASESALPEGKHIMPWVVKDILSGNLYVREENLLWGRLYNELEALGWAADDHPDVDTQGD